MWRWSLFGDLFDFGCIADPGGFWYRQRKAFVLKSDRTDWCRIPGRIRLWWENRKTNKNGCHSNWVANLYGIVSIVSLFGILQLKIEACSVLWWSSNLAQLGWQLGSWDVFLAAVSGHSRHFLFMLTEPKGTASGSHLRNQWSFSSHHLLMYLCIYIYTHCGKLT